MIQIIKLRSFERDGKTVKFDEMVKGVHAESVAELFGNIGTYLKKIPENERWNCFYTLSNCSETKRDFQSLSVMFFDFDNIDRARSEEYIEVVCKVLGVHRHETGIVLSGNGMHFLIGLLTPIVTKEFFTQTKVHYKALIQAVGRALEERGLPVKLDSSVYEPRRIFRLPGTVNRKEGKADTQCVLVQGNIVPIPFDITIASGIPKVAKEDQIDPDSFKRFAKADNAAIFSQCSFMKHAKENPTELDEPELYAALSIIGRMENGKDVAMNVFAPRFGVRRHGGTPEDLESKVEQAVSSSGPRMCKSIAQMHKGCATCPHFKKDSSPIMIKGEDSIPTEHSGFYEMVFDPETQKLKRGKPCFKDLRKYFEREHYYVTHDKMVWVWNGTHYREMSNEEVKNYAQKHFDPYATIGMRTEFLDLIQCTNLVDQEKWNASTFGKINLLNGVLDLETGDLWPHSKELGFKYVLPYSYDKKAKAPRFQKFLQDVCVGDEALIKTLEEFGGYAISGTRCKFHKALVLEGEGKNGKSTFIKTLTAVVGKGSYSSLSFKELESTERRSGLDGVLFNITEETPNKFNDTTSFKNLISGGDIQMRKLYKNAYSVQNKAKLIFSCNEMPTSTDTSEGFFRRFLIVPFKAKFSKELGNLDLKIDEKLQEEIPGILNVFLEGYKRLEKQAAFSKGEDENDQDIEKYKEAIDPLKAFVQECLNVFPLGSDRYTTATDMFAAFKMWCEKYGFDPRSKNAISLGIQLRRYIPDIHLRRKSITENGVTSRRLMGIEARGSDY